MADEVVDTVERQVQRAYNARDLDGCLAYARVTGGPSEDVRALASHRLDDGVLIDHVRFLR